LIQVHKRPDKGKKGGRKRGRGGGKEGKREELTRYLLL
jgi:hypothetical protein